MFKVNMMPDIPPNPKAQPHGESQEVSSVDLLHKSNTMSMHSSILTVNIFSTIHNLYLEESPPPKGALKQGTPLCRRLRKACAVSLASEAGSILQNDPLPGSSWERGTLTKYRFSDKL